MGCLTKRPRESGPGLRTSGKGTPRRKRRNNVGEVVQIGKTQNLRTAAAQWVEQMVDDHDVTEVVLIARTVDEDDVPYIVALCHGEPLLLLGCLSLMEAKVLTDALGGIA